MLRTNYRAAMLGGALVTVLSALTAAAVADSGSGSPRELVVLTWSEYMDPGLIMQGDSLVGLIQGRDRERWQRRVTVSEEPMLMERQDPCVCGSVFFKDWQFFHCYQDG